MTAQDASGESSPSATVSKHLPILVQNVAVSINPATGAALIEWTPDPAATGYVISRTPDDDPAGTIRLIAITNGSASSYTDTTADPTQSYTTP